MEIARQREEELFKQFMLEEGGGSEEGAAKLMEEMKEQEERRLQRLLRDKQLMSICLDKARPCIFADFRDHRIKDGVRACQ